MLRDGTKVFRFHYQILDGRRYFVMYPIVTEARVQIQASLCEICCGGSCTETEFRRSNFFSTPVSVITPAPTVKFNLSVTEAI